MVVDLETAEKLAVESVVAVATERDVLLAEGADAASYLQGQISQDAEGLAPGDTSWTLLLQPQGKVDAWMRLHRLADDRFLLDLDPGHGAAAKERLERFKLRVALELTLATVPVLSFWGPEAERAAASACQAAVAADGAPALLALPGSWAGYQQVDVVALPAADGTPLELDPSLVAGDVAVGPAELAEVMRIRQGKPAMGRELTDSTIPAAAGVVEQSVDFTKGCYVGQELVARVDSRGNNTPTRLHGLRMTGPGIEQGPPAAGAELQLDGAPAGVITSAAGSSELGTIGLAYLKRSVELPAVLEVLTPAGSVQAEVVELPMEAG